VSRENYHHGDLRDELLRQALALILEKGAESLTLRAVARGAGVSHTAPYRHFPDKAALIIAVADEGFRQLTESLREATVGDTPLERFLKGAQAYIQFAVSHPAHYRVMFGPAVVGLGQGPMQLESANEAFAVLLETIVDAQQSGVIKEGDPLHLGVVVWSTVHGAAALMINGLIREENVDPEIVSAHVASTIFEGLAKR
jgi:AcrR family transcriptional regulator